MKRFLILMLSLLLVFSLVACNSNDNPDPSGTNNNEDPLNRDPGTSQSGNQGGTQGGISSGDVSSMFGGVGSSSELYSDMDEESKQAFIAQGS